MKTITKKEELNIINEAANIMVILAMMGYERNFKTALALRFIATTCENEDPRVGHRDTNEVRQELAMVLAMNEVRVVD